MQVISKGELFSLVSSLFEQIDGKVNYEMIDMLEAKITNYDRIDQAHEDDKLDAEE